MKKYFFILLITASFCNIYSQNYTRNQNIVAAEYYTGADPGKGNGIPISGNYGSGDVSVSFDILPGINDLIHLRFKSSNGSWSASYPVLYKKLYNSGAQLLAAEYFINSDPGINNGTPVTIESNNNISLNIYGLSRNDILYLRVKDSFGRWSNARGVKYRYKDIDEAYYYIKTGGGTITPQQGMSVSPAFSNFPLFNAVSGAITMSQGDSVFVRFRSDDYFVSPWFKTDKVTSVEENNIPKEYALYNAYPNPFNPVTTIEYDIPASSDVLLEVYDITGSKVTELVNGTKVAGSYKVQFNAGNYSSGIYLCKISAGKYIKTIKLAVIK